MRIGAETLMIILTLLLSVTPALGTARAGQAIELLATRGLQSTISQGRLKRAPVQGAQVYYSADAAGKEWAWVRKWYGGTFSTGRDIAETEGVTLFVLGALLLGVATTLRLKLIRREEREALSGPLEMPGASLERPTGSLKKPTAGNGAYPRH